MLISKNIHSHNLICYSRNPIGVLCLPSPSIITFQNYIYVSLDNLVIHWGLTKVCPQKKKRDHVTNFDLPNIQGNRTRLHHNLYLTSNIPTKYLQPPFPYIHDKVPKSWVSLEHYAPIYHRPGPIRYYQIELISPIK